MTITLKGDDDVLEQVKKQLDKLEDVIKVIDIKPDNSVVRELVLIKVKADAKKRAAINEIVKIFRCKIIDEQFTCFTSIFISVIIPIFIILFCESLEDFKNKSKFLIL